MNTLKKIVNRILTKMGISNTVIKDSSSCISVAKNTKVSHSILTAKNNAIVEIKDGCILNNVEINVENGHLFIGSNTILNSGGSPEKLQITINEGSVRIGEKSRVQARLWVRFGGTLIIGSYSNINKGSEIRCDESITIGDYNQISYNCMIWDTNTHNIYPCSKRRQMTQKHFPIFGYEYERPITAPIIIGSDCWISQGVTILKGCKIGDEVVIATNTTLIGSSIDNKMLVYQPIQIKQVSRI